METFGARLRRIRIHHKLSLTQLADKSGVPYETIYRAERGTHVGPRVSVAAKLARALGVSLDVLAGVYDEEEIESRFKAAVQAWLEARPCTAEDAPHVEGITAVSVSNA